MITKRLKDLPGEYELPNACPVCGSDTAFRRASDFTWVVSDFTWVVSDDQEGKDGHDGKAIGCCCMRCAKAYEKTLDNNTVNGLV